VRLIAIPAMFDKPAMQRLDRASLTAAIATVSIVGIGLSLTIPLLSVRLEQAQAPAWFNGLNTAVAGLATLIGAPFVPRIAQRVGVWTLLVVALAGAILSLLAFALTDRPMLWLALRLPLGFALTTLFVIGEYWVVAAAPPQRRGLVMGVYSTVLSLGFAIGPALLLLVGTRGPAPILLGAALFCLAGLPVMLARGRTPELEPSAPVPVLGFLVAAPVATLAALVFGAIETGGMGLFPVYAIRAGFGAEAGPLLVTLIAIGNMIFQIPIGHFADSVNRPRFLMALAAFGLAGALAMPAVAAYGLAPLGALLVVWGGLVSGLYTVGLAHLGASFTGARLASANAAFVMFYSLGMLIGPPGLGYALDLWRPNGLFYGLAALFAVYLAVVARRARS
jgi:MFS family permease